MEQAQRFCEECDRYVLSQRPGVNHLLHAILSLFLCGLWVPVWLLIALAHGPPWRCQRCGGPTRWREPDRPERDERPKEKAQPRVPFAVTVNTRSPSWPPACACCLRPADRNLPVVATREHGVDVVREESKTAAVPYCSPCMDHLRGYKKMKARHDEIEAGLAEVEGEVIVARSKARLAASRRSAPTMILALLAAVVVMPASLALFVRVGQTSGVIPGLLVFLAGTAVAALLASAGWFVLRHRDVQAAERIAAEARDAQAEAERIEAWTGQERGKIRAELAAARKAMVDGDSCASELPAVVYIGWKGNFHSFGFRSERYARLFQQENRAKVVG